MNEPRRVEVLLAERAAQGLGSDEAQELDGLLARDTEMDADSFDLAAAAIDLALTRRLEPMPTRVRRAVLERARLEGVGGIEARRLATVADFEHERSRRRPSAEPAPALAATRWAPWLAAAVALILAVAGWWPRAEVSEEIAIATPPTLESVAAASDAIRWSWTGTEDPAVGDGAAVGGEVVWSGAEQRGFMRIRGLAVNDPTGTQYQLWIFDRAQDERYPVDGGVFDIGADGEALIPIDAKIAVDEPYLFAVTVEQPGGVVVSSRERIALLAQA